MSELSLKRFLAAKSIAVFGGSWAENVIAQLQKSGYSGHIWPVHPKRDQILGLDCFADTHALPAAPDAAFIGVNRELTIEVLAQLNSVGAGGAICFASGFRESGLTHETLARKKEGDLQEQLIAAAGDMPVLGPNCYGFLNYLDNVCIWPDQHGGQQVARGAAIVAQSSNIAINMTMQKRGLSLTHMITAGNQAKVGISDIVEELLQDPRVTTIGLYLEGFGDLRRFEEMANSARKAGKPIVAIKIGKSQKAQAATLSHTASLAGNAAASSAFLRRLGIVEVNSITTFIETLKFLDLVGPLENSDICSVSCSGGEASLMADLGDMKELNFPDFTPALQKRLNNILGDKVDIANPLDYHTYVWGDVDTMTACFEAVVSADVSLSVFVLDVPRADLCDAEGHDCAVQAIINAKRSSGKNIAVISCMADNLETEVTNRFIEAGVVPLHGMVNGLAAISAAVQSAEFLKQDSPSDYSLTKQNLSYNTANAILINEFDAKAALKEFGLPTPSSVRIENINDLREDDLNIDFPLVLKGLGLAHKTEAGAVVIGIESFEELLQAADKMPKCREGYILESMVGDVAAELLVGISFDPTGLALLTIGAGGILTELLDDAVTLVLPVSRDDIAQNLSKLKISKILQGYRGKPAVNLQAVIDAIDSIARYAQANCESLLELDVNPLLIAEKNTLAVDALIRVLPQNT